MDLYIANTSEQDHIFHWREPESDRIFNDTVPAGSQVKVLSNKPEDVVKSVIDHHARYGLKSVAEAPKEKDNKVPLVYSIDKPISQDVYGIVQEVNDDINFKQVQLGKEKMAYSFAKGIERDSEINQGVKEVELEIVEEVPKEPGRKNKDRVVQKFTSEVKK